MLASRRVSGLPHILRGLSFAALAVLALSACENRNRGVSPVGQGLYFPSGITLDPRVPDDVQARWLFVLNGNSDLVYNAGSIVPLDLVKFFDAWMIDADACFAGDAEGCKVGTGLVGEGGTGPTVGDVGATLTADVPCRRNSYKPQVVECEDTLFVEEDAAVQVGSFGTSLRGWTREVVTEPQSEGRLFAAVRGDPSITFVELSGDPQDVPTIDCGQGPDSGLYDPRRCAGDHKLTFLRNDPDSARIASEPSNILARSGSPYVLVTHATRSALTLIDMDGQYDRRDKSSKDGEPAIVQMQSFFEFAGAQGGGWGLAERPCTPGNAPTLQTGPGQDGEPQQCRRPMIYAGFRTAFYVARSIITETDPLRDTIDLAWVLEARNGLRDVQIPAAMEALAAASGADEEAALRTQLDGLIALRDFYTSLLGDTSGPEVSFDQQCLLASEIAGDALNDDDTSKPSTAGAFLCDARVYNAGLFRAAAFDTGATSGVLLGDMAFSRDGNRLFVVQTNPGGLAFIDTSLDSQGRPRDQPAGLIELCAQPTGMQVFYDGESEYAAITCYQPQEVFIVDLGGVRVIANISVGNGPHPMAIDPARNLMYVANTLDKTVSVVDLSPRRATRFVEIARIGRQVPYNR